MAYYTTATEVRDEAGLNTNPSITDAMIEAEVKQAHAEILGMIGAIYKITNLTTDNPLFVGSQAEDYLKRAEILISAGYILWKDFGTQNLDKDSDGEQKVAAGRAMISAFFQNGKDAPAARLFDKNGTEFERATSVGSSVAPVCVEETTPVFTMDLNF